MKLSTFQLINSIIEALSSECMDLSIVIPVYNEEKIIQSSLRKMLDFVASYKGRCELIVVNDGSKDKTEEIVKSFGNKLKFINYTDNKGKGYALKTGVNSASGKYIYIADADLSTPIEEINKFLNYIPKYDCVVGSRAHKGAKEESSILRIVAGKVGNGMIKLLLDLDISDTQCGFKMFTSKLKKDFVNCSTNGFGYDFEFLRKISQKGYQIKEIPVKWTAGEKSSVTFRSYLRTLLELIKIWKCEVGFTRNFAKSVYYRTEVLRKYLIVGIFTNFLNISIFMYLLYNNLIQGVDVLNIYVPNYVFIESIAYVVGVIANFLLHKFLTFESHKWKWKELLRYLALLIVNYLASVCMLYIMIDLINLSEGIAKLVSILFIVSWNFLVLKFFVYRM